MFFPLRHDTVQGDRWVSDFQIFLNPCKEDLIDKRSKKEPLEEVTTNLWKKYI